MRLKEFLLLLDGVSEEHRICRTAAERFRMDIDRDPTILRKIPVERSKLNDTIRRLEHTYIVRAFAVFEWALRDIWKNALRRSTEPSVHDLIDAAAAARRFMPSDQIRKTHEVRTYRNNIVHLNSTLGNSFTLAECASRLKMFLSLMPREW